MESQPSQFSEFLEQPANPNASNLSPSYSYQYPPSSQQSSNSQQPFPFQFIPQRTYAYQYPSSSQLSQGYHYPFTPQYQVPTDSEKSQVEPPSKPRKMQKSKRVASISQKRRTRNFSVKEDDALVRSWMAILEDGIVGNSQSRNTLWDRIFNNFNKLLGIERPNEDDDRNPNSLACRWQIIQQKVNKFIGYFAIVDRNPRSGTTFDDRIEEAKKTYRSLEDHDFHMEEAWKLLRDNPKFNEKYIASKKRKNAGDAREKSTHSSLSPSEHDCGEEGEMNVTTANGIDRPEMGRKKSKEKNKRAVISEGSSSAIREFMSKFDDSMKQQVALSEKEIKSKEDMSLKDLELKERYLQQKDQDRRLKQWLAEKEILEKDLTGMAPRQVEIFQKLQENIWQKWQQDGTII